MAFKYRKQSEAAVRQEAEQSGGGYASIFIEGTKEFKPKKGGEYTIRVAPPTWGTDDDPPTSYAHEVFVNFGVGPDEEGFISRSRMGFDDDPVVEMHDRLRQFGDEYVDLLKEQKAKKRRTMYVLVRGEEELGWQAWAPGWTIHRDMAKASMSKRKRTVKFIDDPDNGYDVTFSRESSGFGKFTIDEVDDESSPIVDDPKRQKELLDWLVEHPLPDQYRIYSYEEIKRRCDGQANKTEDEDDADPDDVPQTRMSARRQAAEHPDPEHDDSHGPPGPEDDDIPFDAGADPVLEDTASDIDDADADIDEPPPPPPRAPKRRGAKKTGGLRRPARARD